MIYIAGPIDGGYLNNWRWSELVHSKYTTIRSGLLCEFDLRIRREASFVFVFSSSLFFLLFKNSLNSSKSITYNFPWSVPLDRKLNTKRTFFFQNSISNIFVNHFIFRSDIDIFRFYPSSKERIPMEFSFHWVEFAIS